MSAHKVATPANVSAKTMAFTPSEKAMFCRMVASVCGAAERLKSSPSSDQGREPTAADIEAGGDYEAREHPRK